MIPYFSFDSNLFNDNDHDRVSAEMVAAAIASLVEIARYQGKSLEDLITEVLAEDQILDQGQRHWLSKIVTQAWKSFTD